MSIKSIDNNSKNNSSNICQNKKTGIIQPYISKYKRISLEHNQNYGKYLKSKYYNTPKPNQYNAKGGLKKVIFRQGGYVDCYIREDTCQQQMKQDILKTHKIIAQNQGKLGENKRICSVVHVRKDLDSNDYIRLNKYPETLKYDKHLDGIQAKYLAKDSLQGLSDLKKLGFINHGDFKPDNIAHFPQQGKFLLSDLDGCIQKRPQQNALYSAKVINQACYQNERAYGRSKQFFEQRQIKAIGKLINIVSQDQKANKQIVDILQKNKNKSYEATLKQMENNILKQYKKQCSSQIWVMGLSSIYNVIKSLQSQKLNDQKLRVSFKQLGKAAVSFGGLFYKKISTEKQILSSYLKNNYRPGFWYTFNIGIAVQFGKCFVNWVLGDQKSTFWEEFKNTSASCGSLMINMAVNKGMSYVAQKLSSFSLKGIVNYAANNSSRIVFAAESVVQGTLKQTFKAAAKDCAIGSAIGGIASFAAGTIVDCVFNGKPFKEAVKQNGKNAVKSTVGSYIGSVIGSCICPGVGTAIGGFVGSVLGSLFPWW